MGGEITTEFQGADLEDRHVAGQHEGQSTDGVTLGVRHENKGKCFLGIDCLGCAFLPVTYQGLEVFQL